MRLCICSSDRCTSARNCVLLCKRCSASVVVKLEAACKRCSFCRSSVAVTASAWCLSTSRISSAAFALISVAAARCPVSAVSIACRSVTCCVFSVAALTAAASSSAVACSPTCVTFALSSSIVLRALWRSCASFNIDCASRSLCAADTVTTSVDRTATSGFAFSFGMTTPSGSSGCIFLNC